MTVLNDIILESGGKHYYACISSKIWGSLFMSGAVAGIPWGILNRTMSATVSSTLKEAVIRWIKHNNFIKNVSISGNTITVDSEWWEKEKNTEVVVLDSPEKNISPGVISDKVIYGPRTQHGGIISGGGDFLTNKKEFAKKTGIKSSAMTIETAIKKAGLKIKTGNTGVDVTGPINAIKKFNGWESSDMYTEREVRELLEQAFAEGYDDGIDDTLDYIDENYELEDGGFDLMDEYESLQETKSANKEIHKNIMSKNFRRDGNPDIYLRRDPKDKRFVDQASPYDNRGRKYNTRTDQERHETMKKAILAAKNGDNSDSNRKEYLKAASYGDEDNNAKRLKYRRLLNKASK